MRVDSSTGYMSSAARSADDRACSFVGVTRHEFLQAARRRRQRCVWGVVWSSLLCDLRGMNAPPSRSEQLRVLFVSAFDEEGLRRFVRFGPDGTTLAPELPGGIASLAGLAAAAVELFERVHLVTDASFWRRLATERSRRAEEIEAVRVLYMTSGVHAMPPLQTAEDLLDALAVIGFFRELARLFEVQRVVNLMRRVGLDAASFPEVGTPTRKAWWEFVAGEIRQGGGERAEQGRPGAGPGGARGLPRKSGACAGSRAGGVSRGGRRL